MIHSSTIEKWIHDGLYIGVDGCRCGWIAAILEQGGLRVEQFQSIDELIECYPKFDAFLIDMVIGLRDNKDQTRPDTAARKELGTRACTVFSAPSRKAVYAENEEEKKAANNKALGRSLSKQSIAIIPKIKELDQFLLHHPEYQGRILESHPELCFKCLKGSVVLSRKKDCTGFAERERILSDYLNGDSLTWFYSMAKVFKCHPDDLMDAACLAVVGALHAHGMSETIPEVPDFDATGLEMKLTVPRKDICLGFTALG